MVLIGCCPPTKMADNHSHCYFCISPNCDHFDGCPVQICSECGSRVHSCKLNDHSREICPEHTLQCINAQYGCTETGIKRKDLLNHMEHCPVMMELIIPSGVIQCEDCWLTINEYDLQDHHKVCMERVMPCLNRSSGCVQSVKRKDLNIHLEHCPASILNCGYAYERLTLKQYEIHDGISAICNDEFTTVLDEKFLQSDIERSGEYSYLSLRTIRCAYSLYNYSSERYIKCPEMIRRDEFSSHWQSHLDFIDFLPEIVTRCPLFTYGCTYSITNFQPSPPGSKLDYNPGIPSFVVLPPYPKSLEERHSTTSYENTIAKKQELSAYGYADSVTGSLDVIGQLPVEVLFTVLSYCDSQSLWALSQVNTYLRDLCWELVTKKGVVYCKWCKNEGESRWTLSGKVWINMHEMLFCNSFI